MTATIPATVSQKVMRPPAPRPGVDRGVGWGATRQDRTREAARDPGDQDGQAAREAAGEHERERAGADGDGELDPGADERDEEGQEGEREDQVDAELGRVGDRRAEQEAAERGEVPHHEEAELDAEQKRERPLLRRRGDAEGLVGEEERRDRALAPRQVEQRGRARARRGGGGR